MTSLILLVVTFLLIWFLFVRPQQRRVREHQQLISSIQVGDEVVTAGGLHGHVTELTDEFVHLEVAPGTAVRVVRQAISRRLGPERAESD